MLITTERLTITPAVAGDLPTLERTWTDPLVRRHLGGPLSAEAAAARRTTEDLTGARAVRAAGDIVGFCFLGRHRSGDTELSYTFLPEHWGRGYAHEACMAVLAAVLRTDAGPRRVVAVTQVANARSRRLLDRLGMVETGRFVEHGEPQVMYAADRVGLSLPDARWQRRGAAGR
ncbi:GNAT family N-acetyltransferase [Micromonospora phytophila]|uniref:GNAT family N-acetyltransferase n=1 Tax=Micromonospora phytophila TaxID=709888 RepID=UPI00202F9DBE|nr:GNAT family N-acetyltransferase [Micromonospora phytophila]MCM0675609.1 GNAT family N-acetyltransferase [Micromonospora phytophila]